MITQQNELDEKFMHRALELALLGMGKTRPNPLVGCVIVHEGRIIGEGWHERYGEAHAEVNAINSVKDKKLLPLATVYVTLEPCAHFGKTPPCADLLIKEKVRRVVISNLDTNPLVAGKGIDKLRNAGIEITTNICESQGRAVNKRFFTFMEKKRPYIILKWAQTSDHFIARENYDSKWISNSVSRQLVHKWRTEEHSILVGTKTAERDNPQLTVRDWSGQNPIRIVIDKNTILNKSLHLFDGTVPTICYNLHRTEEQNNVSYVKINANGFEHNLLQDLYERKIQSILIEGGSKTTQSFIDLGLWDEARIFTSTITFKNGISAPRISGKITERVSIADDTLEYVIPII